MNLGVETITVTVQTPQTVGFQHSLMNLGVETGRRLVLVAGGFDVSAFSDESWGGDQHGRTGAVGV